MLRGTRLFIIISMALCSADVQAQRVTSEKARDSFEAIGRTIADFQHCEGDWQSIQDAGLALARRCSINSQEQTKMRRIMDQAADDRTDAIESQGGACAGQLDQRRAAILRVIHSAIADCQE